MFGSTGFDVAMAGESVFVDEVVSVERVAREGNCEKLLRGILIGVIYLLYN
jgi:hypothetical protein